jgi:hypothetical protein
MPGFIKPQMATLKAKAPPGDQWLHEIKFDGYRVQVHLNKGKKRAFTRTGLDWTKRFFRDRRRIGCSAALDICDRHRKPTFSTRRRPASTSQSAPAHAAQATFCQQLESARHAALSCGRQGIQDDGAVSDPESVPGVRQADEARRRRERP